MPKGSNYGSGMSAGSTALSMLSPWALGIYSPLFMNALLKNDRQGYRKSALQFLQDQYGINNSDAEYLLDQYKNDDWNILNPSTWGNKGGYDLDALQKDYEEFQKWQNEMGEMPEMVDIDNVIGKAGRDIDAENAQLNALYDQMLGRSQNLYQTELNNSNQAYNDYVGQVLSNQAQSQNMMQGGIRNELDRQQRNAITRGASAAMRLVSNINSQLGMQNQAAQNSLNTSNVLAQSLLNQRQAASQLRQGYSSEMNADASRRAGLISGTAERKTSLANGRLQQANDIYNQKMDQWNDRLGAYAGTNPWADYYRNNQIKTRTGTSTYGI